jgi:hypothetical protein
MKLSGVAVVWVDNLEQCVYNIPKSRKNREIGVLAILHRFGKRDDFERAGVNGSQSGGRSARVSLALALTMYVTETIATVDLARRWLFVVVSWGLLTKNWHQHERQRSGCTHRYGRSRLSQTTGPRRRQTARPPRRQPQRQATVRRHCRQMSATRRNKNGIRLYDLHSHGGCWRCHWPPGPEHFAIAKSHGQQQQQQP